MHEAMEQQTVTVNKANIHVTLMARTTVIAAANPILGRYDQNKTIADNIKNLPATLLSRFDLIFVIVDKVEKEKDELLVKHILEDEEEYQKIDRSLLKNYIIYAKQFNPVLTVEAKSEIKKFYLESRKRQSPNDPIPITARQLESLMRLAQAHAKLLFKENVDASDAEAAIHLLSESLRQTCKFQTTEADSSRTENPIGMGGKEMIMYDILVDNGELKEEEWRALCAEKQISKEEFVRILSKLNKSGKIMQSGFSGMYPTWTKV
jgi:replicative DNA helicase Mcm